MEEEQDINSDDAVDLGAVIDSFTTQVADLSSKLAMQHGLISKLKRQLSEAQQVIDVLVEEKSKAEEKKEKVK